MTNFEKNLPPNVPSPPSYLKRVLTAIGIFPLVAVLFLIVRESLDILLLIYAGVLFGNLLNWLKCKITSRTRIPPGIALAVLVIFSFALLLPPSRCSPR